MLEPILFPSEKTPARRPRFRLLKQWMTHGLLLAALVCIPVTILLYLALPGLTVADQGNITPLLATWLAYLLLFFMSWTVCSYSGGRLQNAEYGQPVKAYSWLAFLNPYPISSLVYFYGTLTLSGMIIEIILVAMGISPNVHTIPIALAGIFFFITCWLLSNNARYNKAKAAREIAAS